MALGQGTVRTLTHACEHNSTLKHASFIPVSLLVTSVLRINPRGLQTGETPGPTPASDSEQSCIISGAGNSACEGCWGPGCRAASVPLSIHSRQCRPSKPAAASPSADPGRGGPSSAEHQSEAAVSSGTAACSPRLRPHHPSALPFRSPLAQVSTMWPVKDGTGRKGQVQLARLFTA